MNAHGSDWTLDAGSSRAPEDLDPGPEHTRRAARRLSRYFLFGSVSACLAFAACRTDSQTPEGRSAAGQAARPGGKGSDKNHQGRGVETRVVFFGDSITQAGTGPEGYVTIVEKVLKGRYPDRDIQVLAAGVTGDTVADLQGRLSRDVLSEEPTHVVVYIGVNEVGQRRSVSRLSEQDRASYRTGLMDILRRVRAAGAQPYLCTPAVFGDDPDSGSNENRLLEQYSEISRSVAAEAGVPLCDLRSAFAKFLRAHNRDRRFQGVLTVDGVHLNAKGNHLVSQEILKVLKLAEATTAPAAPTSPGPG